MDDDHVLCLYPPQQDLMSHLDRLKFFLATAPSRWSALDVAPTSQQHPALNRFLLPSGEYVTCVLWSGLYHITGTDIVRALVFRFEAFGRPVRNMKKFEEGVFSDLRNLKPGHDACLEEPKSPFLDLLFKYQCIRTQKKQKVFYWFSVPHDRLFLDALERDLKREKMGQEPTTAITAEPAASFSYDPKRSLYEQFAAAKSPDDALPDRDSPTSASSASLPELDCAPDLAPAPRNPLARTQFFNMFALFEGSPTYKQRRKKAPKPRRAPFPGPYAPDEHEHEMDAEGESPQSQYPDTPQFAYDAASYTAGYTPGYSPTDSRGSSDALPYYAPPAPPPHPVAPQQQHPVSAPAHRVAFDVVYPTLPALPGRPRSVTPSLPTRAPHARRPSTAEARYHPYAAPPRAPAEDVSPFAYGAGYYQPPAPQQAYEYAPAYPAYSAERYYAAD